MLKKYFLRKTLRKSLVKLSGAKNPHVTNFIETYNKTIDLLIDLSMTEDEIQRRVGLNTALIADLDNLKLGKAQKQIELVELEKQVIEQRELLKQLKEQENQHFNG